MVQDYPERRGRYTDKREKNHSRNTPYSRRKQIGKQEANELERPCRRLFVRNINFNTTENDIRDLFEPFGEVKNFCDLIEKRGICFLTFFDLRGAEDAKNSLTGHDIGGRQINIHFSLPKEDAAQTGKCGRDKDQGTVKVILRNSSKILEKSHLSIHFERFGQIMNIADTSDPKVMYVEYWDSRDCIAAIDEISKDEKYLDGNLEVEYSWDKFDRLSDRSRSAYAFDNRKPLVNSNLTNSHPPSNSQNLNALLQQRLQSLKPQSWTQGPANSPPIPWQPNPMNSFLNVLQTQNMGHIPHMQMPNMYGMPVGGMMGGMPPNMPPNMQLNMPNEAERLQYAQQYIPGYANTPPMIPMNQIPANAGLSGMPREQIEQLMSLLQRQ